MIKLNGQKQVTGTVGDTFVYTFHSHPSVGFEANFKLEPEGVLELEREDKIYDHPDRLEIVETGADGGQGLFVFVAKQVGSTILTVNHEFRGDLEEQAVIEVVIQ